MPWILSSYLIGNFLWRTLTAAHFYPSRTSMRLEMAVDALLIAGLFSLKAKIPPGLFWTALVCGIGLFAIRLNGDASWWTGHLMFSIPAR